MGTRGFIRTYISFLDIYIYIYLYVVALEAAGDRNEGVSHMRAEERKDDHARSLTKSLSFVATLLQSASEESCLFHYELTKNDWRGQDPYNNLHFPIWASYNSNKFFFPFICCCSSSSYTYRIHWYCFSRPSTSTPVVIFIAGVIYSSFIKFPSLLGVETAIGVFRARCWYSAKGNAISFLPVVLVWPIGFSNSNSSGDGEFSEMWEKQFKTDKLLANGSYKVYLSDNDDK